MQVYPAYTIDKIETELSWREVKELMKYWSDGTTSYQALTRIEKMIEKKFGFEKVSSKPLHGEELVNRLTQEGWL